MLDFSFDAVIFDMDGLMFDTERLAVRSWARAAAESGFDFPESLLMKTVGRDKEGGKRIIMDHFGADFPYDRVREKRLRYFMEAIDSNGVPIKEGLRELMEHLAERGVPVAVATSTDRPRASVLLERAGVLPRLAALVCGDMVARSKPDPEIYLTAARSLGREPSRCLVLEDSRPGIAAAHAAGMRAIMVPDLVGPDETALAQAWKICGSLTEVRNLLAGRAGRKDGRPDGPRPGTT